MMIPVDADRDEAMQLCIGWSSPTISQNCDWEVSYLITKVGEDTEGGGTTVQSYEESSSVADGLVRSVFTISASSIDSDDFCIHIVIERDGNDANDDLGAVAELHGIALGYTANKLGS